MVLHHWQHNIKINCFSNNTYFANDVSINFLFWIHCLFIFHHAFLLVNFNIMQLQLINFTITHQLHHYLSYLVPFSFQPWIFWQLPNYFQVSSCFLCFFGCCECWLPRITLTLASWKTLIMFIDNVQKGQSRGYLRMWNG